MCKVYVESELARGKTGKNDSGGRGARPLHSQADKARMVMCTGAERHLPDFAKERGEEGLKPAVTGIAY